jgi:hypothetical protein
MELCRKVCTSFEAVLRSEVIQETSEPSTKVLKLSAFTKLLAKLRVYVAY